MIRKPVKRNPSDASQNSSFTIMRRGLDGGGGGGPSSGSNSSSPAANNMELQPLTKSSPSSSGSRGGGVGVGSGSAASSSSSSDHAASFWAVAMKFAACFGGLQASYLTWGYMQELIMTTQFTPTPRVPDGKFPSAAFCVFSNRFLAVLVALIAVRLRHGAFLAHNKAPLTAFTPCALSNTISSWSQYASLKYVSFPVQTVFKSSKVIPVMLMGKFLKGTVYPVSQYLEAFLITVGVAVFSILSKSPKKGAAESTDWQGLLFLLGYISADSFTSQWQSRIYRDYGKQNVDPYQMMLGVNVSAILLTSAGLLLSGDVPVVYEFVTANPIALRYNVITAITSASGQLCIFYTIKEFGPIVFTIIMTVRQMFSIIMSAVVFGHEIQPQAAAGAALVFGVLWFQIHKKYKAAASSPHPKKQSGGKAGGSSAVSGGGMSSSSTKKKMTGKPRR